MAAMNGLTMSRPMVLALMNDESRAPKDERVRLIQRQGKYKIFEDPLNLKRWLL